LIRLVKSVTWLKEHPRSYEILCIGL
jgi:hypothetical protein